MGKSIIILALAILFLFSPTLVVAQQAIFLVRHGETVAPKGEARPLSEAGQHRAALLGKILKDAGIKAIFTSGIERTIKTAEPLAQTLRITPKALSQLNVPGIKQTDVDAFIALLRAEHRDDIVLVVGHTGTVPVLLKTLGHPVDVHIPETEFDNLFVLIPKAEGPPIVMRLRY
jgi:broad specificity phosphatase PhoE